MAETVTLGSIANLKTGPFGTQFSASEYSATGTPILNVKSIGHGVVLRDDLDYVPDSVRDRLAAHTLVEGDIVFARKGSVDRHAYVSATKRGGFRDLTVFGFSASTESTAGSSPTGSS